MSDTEQIIGGIGSVDPNVAQAISDAIKAQAKLQPFTHGSTAAYWHVIATLNQHLKDKE